MNNGKKKKIVDMSQEERRAENLHCIRKKITCYQRRSSGREGRPDYSGEIKVLESHERSLSAMMSARQKDCSFRD